MASIQGHTGKNGKASPLSITATMENARGVDPSLIGICVVHQKEIPFIRISLRPHHLKDIGVAGGRVDVRGTLRDGLLIAPGKGYKPYVVGRTLVYLQFGLKPFDSRVDPGQRSTIWLRPKIENGHIQLPGVPAPWLAREPEFERGVYHESPQVFEPGKKTSQLSPFPGDPAATVRQDSERPPAPPVPPAPPASTQGATAPLPRAQQVPDYHVPSNLREMEYALASKIGEVRGLLQAMQDKTGLQFTLDRNLRVAVVLREKPDK